MRKKLTFKEVLIKVLETIVCVPIAIIGAILLIPFVLLALLISLPASIFDDIWELNL